MITLRTTLRLAILAGVVMTATALSLGYAVRRPVVVLYPDSLGPPQWAVCRPDSSGLRWSVQWWPARQR